MTIRKPLLLALAVAHLTCGDALMTAPPGSSITLTANPEFIPSNGGVSQIAAFVVEPLGTTVPDGTVVQFFTNLGRVDREARTKDGVARVNLISDSRSGTATVTAVSGGAATGGGLPSPSPSPGPGPGPITAAATASVSVRIGAVLPVRVIVTADPSRITISRSTHIFATVLDGNGNPVPNVGVVFTVNSFTEFMDSEGHPIFTDNNGRAEDVLRTRRTTPGSVVVDVRVLSSNNVTGSVSVPILLQ